uniref:Uncharacterized protein n=1 Tax=Megaselia scalaris TaxID=36166 RepID=T1GV72_MEGSC
MNKEIDTYANREYQGKIPYLYKDLGTLAPWCIIPFCYNEYGNWQLCNIFYGSAFFHFGEAKPPETSPNTGRVVF